MKAPDASLVTIEVLMVVRLRHILEELLPRLRRVVYMCVYDVDYGQRAKETIKLLIAFIYKQNRITSSIYSSYKYVKIH